MCVHKLWPASVSVCKLVNSTLTLLHCANALGVRPQLSNLADDGETWPLALTNDIDLVTIWRAISAGPDTF